MPKLRVTSGKDLVKIFSSFGFNISSQRGSQLKLLPVLPDGSKQILTIPLHDELDRETLKEIIRRASRFVPKEELKQFLRTD